MNNTVAVCICGKLCTSKPGLTLHQRRCDKAKQALSSGSDSVIKSDIIVPKIYNKELSDFVSLAELIACDADLTLSKNNKSAGRRARNNLIKLRDMIRPLRKKILDSMK